MAIRHRKLGTIEALQGQILQETDAGAVVDNERVYQGGSGAKYEDISSQTYKTSIERIRVSSNLNPNIIYITPDGGNWEPDPSDTTTPDNTGTVLVAADGLRLKRKFSGAIHIDWFKPLGGGADDTTVIQDALDSAPDSSFVINDEYVVDGLSIQGQTLVSTNGMGCIKKKDGSSTTTLISCTSETSVARIEGLILDGNWQGISNRGSVVYLDCFRGEVINCVIRNSAENGVFVSVKDSAIISGCSFEGMSLHTGNPGESSKCIHVTGDGQGEGYGEVIITNNTFTGDIPDTGDEHRATGGIFCSFDLNKSMIISENIFRNLGQSGPSGSGGTNYIGNIDLYHSVSRTIISNNKFYNYFYTPLKLQNSSNVIVDSNYIGNPGHDGDSGHGILYQPNARNYPLPGHSCIISNNIVTKSNNIGISVLGDTVLPVEKVVISNNIINEAVRGIVVSRCSGNIVIDNIIVDTTSGNAIEFNQSSGEVCASDIVIKNGWNGFRFLDTNSNLSISISNAIIHAEHYPLEVLGADVLQVSNSRFVSNTDKHISIDNIGTSVFTGCYIPGDLSIHYRRNTVTKMIESANSWQPVIVPMGGSSDVNFTLTDQDGTFTRNMVNNITLTISGASDGDRRTVIISNTDTNPHTVTITGVPFPNGADNEIPAGGRAHISLQQIDGVIDARIELYG